MRRSYHSASTPRQGGTGGPADGRTVTAAETPSACPPDRLSGIFRGYASLARPRDHPQRATAQSEGDHGRAAAARAHGRHRSVGLGQELPRLRHPVRGGSATLHRVALHLRQAVPRTDAETARGRDRRHRAGRGDRAEEPHHEQPLHGRHGDRDLRFPPAAVGARGDAVLREMRARGEGSYGAGGGGRADSGMRSGRPRRRSRQLRAPHSALRARDHFSPARERSSARCGCRGAAPGGRVCARAGGRRAVTARRAGR